MRKHAFFLVVLLCISLVCGACSDKQSVTTSQQTNGNENNINALDLIIPTEYTSVEGLHLEPASCLSIIVQDIDDPYWKTFEKGANQAIQDLNLLLNYTDDNEITLSYCAPRERDDIDDQVSLLDEELARFPVAVGIAPIDEKAFGVQFDLAKEDGIPVVTLHAATINENMNSHIGTDNFAAAKIAATELAKSLNNAGEVAVFVHDTTIDAQNRLEGFTSTLQAEYPDIKISIFNVSDFKATEQPQETIKEKLNTISNLKGIFTTDAHTTHLVAESMTKEQVDSITLIGFDGGKSQMNLLKKGSVDGLLLQNPYGMGYATVVAMVRSSLGLSVESFVDSGYVWVTNENKESATVKNFIY